MSTAGDIVVTIVAIAGVGILLAVGWAVLLRRFGVRIVERPREDQDLQMHQAAARSQVSP